MKRRCKSCGIEYTYEASANFMIFCPNCNRYDYLECEYGYGPVVPCKIYYLNKEIGMVTHEPGNGNKYRLDSDYFHLHKVLNHTYLDALHEARDMVSDLIDREMNHRAD